MRLIIRRSKIRDNTQPGSPFCWAVLDMDIPFTRLGNTGRLVRLSQVWLSRKRELAEYARNVFESFPESPPNANYGYLSDYENAYFKKMRGGDHMRVYKIGAKSGDAAPVDSDELDQVKAETLKASAAYPGMVATYAGDIFSPVTLAENFGPGKYVLFAKDGSFSRQVVGVPTAEKK